MKPNTIELDEKGIFCYEAPVLLNGKYRNQEVVHSINKSALEQAKRDRVYFRDQYKTANNLAPLLSIDKFKESKYYPVPDEYDVKIEENPTTPMDQTSYPSFDKYAILVLKQEMVYQQTPSGLRMTDRPMIPKKEEGIQQSAMKYASYHNHSVPHITGHYEAYIAGAKSDAAKEYWYQKFKQKKS